MSAISGYISTIQNAVYGEQVRTAIVNALLACYSDVENPDLQSAAFQTAIENAYEDGILDIITVTSFNDMTNQNIIYRYNGTAAGKQKGLYYYSALSSSWVLIGSEIQKVSLASQMTDVNDIYRYIGTETGMKQNSLYCHNGTDWIPIGNDVETDPTLTEEGKPADAKATGDAIAAAQGKIKSPYIGKTFNFLGDSITLGTNITRKYWQFVASLLGCTANAYGVSGSSIAQNGTNPSQAFYLRYADMANGADVVVVMGGTNDKWHGSTLGTMGDTTGATFYGAMDVLCQGLRTKYPAATIVFITPAEMAGYTFDATATVEQFADAIKEVCDKYAINVFDHRIISGIYPQVTGNKEQFTTDGVHLNNLSHELLGKRLTNYLLELAGYPPYVLIDPTEDEGGGGETAVLTNGTYSDTYASIEVTNGRHVKVIATRQCFVVFSDPSKNSNSGSNTHLNSLPTWETLQANKTTTYTLKNISMSSNTNVAVAARVAMSNTNELNSGNFTDSTDKTVTAQPSSNVDISCFYVYLNQACTLEFDFDCTFNQ